MSVTLSGDWRRLRVAINPAAFNQRLKKEVGRATLLNVKIVQKHIRATLQGIGPANAPLTIEIKKSKKPLIDFGDLRKAIQGRRLKFNLGVAGVNVQSASYNIGLFLHDGGTITVTDRMRNMFKLLFYVSQGRLDPSMLTGRARELYDRNPGVSWRPINTGSIKIPGRPFVKQTLEDKSLLEKVRKNYLEAVKRAHRGY